MCKIDQRTVEIIAQVAYKELVDREDFSWKLLEEHTTGLLKTIRQIVNSGIETPPVKSNATNQGECPF